MTWKEATDLLSGAANLITAAKPYSIQEIAYVPEAGGFAIRPMGEEKPTIPWAWIIGGIIAVIAFFVIIKYVK